MLTPDESALIGSARIEDAWSLVEAFSTMRRQDPRGGRRGRRGDRRDASPHSACPSRCTGRASTSRCRRTAHVTLERPALRRAAGAARGDRAGGADGAAGLRREPRSARRRAGRRAAPRCSARATTPRRACPTCTGKIVLFRGMILAEKILGFAALGAAGGDRGQSRSRHALGQRQRDLGHARPRRPALAHPIPGCARQQPDGDALIEAASRGASATLTTVVEEGWFDQVLPEVRIPGTDDPDRFVLLHGHYDSWDVGVGDNATGDACMLEAARVLHAHRGRLQRGVRICWWPGHSTGKFAGSTWYADAFARDLARGCVAHLNCDSPGCRDATDYPGIPWMAENRAFVTEAVHDVTGKAAGGKRPIAILGLLLQQPRHLRLLQRVLPHPEGRGGAARLVLRDGQWRQHRLAHRPRPARRCRSRRAADRHPALCAGGVPAGDAGGDPARSCCAGGGAARPSRPLRQGRGLALRLRAGARGAAGAGRPASRRSRLASPDPVTATATRLAVLRHLVPLDYTRGTRYRRDIGLPAAPLTHLAVAAELDRYPPEALGFALASLTRGQNHVRRRLRGRRRGDPRATPIPPRPMAPRPIPTCSRACPTRRAACSTSAAAPAGSAAGCAPRATRRRLIGVEPDPALAAHAERHYDLVHRLDIEREAVPLEAGSLDVLVYRRRAGTPARPLGRAEAGCRIARGGRHAAGLRAEPGTLVLRRAAAVGPLEVRGDGPVRPHPPALVHPRRDAGGDPGRRPDRRSSSCPASSTATVRWPSPGRWRRRFRRWASIRTTG